MTVLQLISSGGYYGAESMLVNLSRELVRLGCNSILGAFYNNYNPHIEVAERVRECGLPAEIVCCRSRWDRETVRTIRELIARYDVSLVHTHGPKPNAYALAAARGAGIPLVATYHLDWPDRGLSLYAYHLLDRVLLRRFAHVAGVSPHIVDSLRRAGLPAERLSMIPNGIRFEEPRGGTSLFRQRLGTGGRKIVGVVGRLVPQKGHEYLIAAIPKILAEFPGAAFVFVGDGPLRAQLEERAGSSVVFAGEQTDMADVYAGIDIFVLPSINEGMPMAILEALGAGLPVIATRVGAVPQLVEDGETGLLVEPRCPDALAAAVSQLLGSPERAATLADAGRRRAARDFSAEAMARRYLDVYRSLARPAPVRAAAAAPGASR